MLTTAVRTSEVVGTDTIVISVWTKVGSTVNNTNVILEVVTAITGSGPRTSVIHT